MKPDSSFSFLKKLNFETFENNDCFYYDYIEQLIKNNKNINIRYNIAIIQNLIDSYIDECAYTGDNESFENVIGSINSILIKDSSNIYARNKAAFLYYTKYIYDFDDIYYDMAVENLNKILYYGNEISCFILAILYQAKYANTKDNQYFEKALEYYKDLIEKIGNDININYNIYLLYKSKFSNVEKHFNIAADAYSNIINTDNENIFILSHLAKLYRDKFLSTKNPDYYLKSVNYYMELSYISNDINILFNLGFLHTLMFKYNNDWHFYEEALSVLDQLKCDDNKKENNILYNLLGLLYTIKYISTKNIEDFTLAINYYNKNIDSMHYFMGHLYLIHYNNIKDESYFNSALSEFNALDTDETDVLNSIAYLYETKFKLTKEKKDFLDAMNYYNRALAIDRDYLYTYINRFELYRLAFYCFDDSNYFTLIINDYEILFNEGQLYNNKLLSYYTNYNIGCFYYNLYADSLEEKNAYSKYNLKDEFFNKALLFFTASNIYIAISDLYRLKYIDEHNTDKYFDLALSYADQNLNTFRYDIKNLLQKAILYYEKYRISKKIEDFDHSLEYFDYALNINKYDKTVYYNLALIHHFRFIESKSESYEEAEKNYTAAIEFDHSYYKAIENLGFLYCSIYSINNEDNLFDKSMSYFNNILINNQNSLTALEGIGDLYNIKIYNNEIDKTTKYSYISKCINSYEKAISLNIGINTIYKKLQNIYFILFKEYSDTININSYFEKYINLLATNRSLANKYLFILNNVMYDIHKNIKYLIKASKCLSGINTDVFSIRMCAQFFKYLFDISKKTKYALFAIFYLEYLSNIDRSNIDHYFEIGVLYYKVYLNTRNYEYIIHSFHCCSRVLDLNPNYPKCNYNRALILKHLFEKTLKIDYIENAFENLSQSIKLGNIEAYSLLGDIYLLLYKKHKKEEEYLNKAIENYNLSIDNKHYGKNPYNVYFNLGICYYFKYKEHRNSEEYYNHSFLYYKKALSINRRNIKIRRFIKYLQILKRLPPSQ